MRRSILAVVVTALVSAAAGSAQTPAASGDGKAPAGDADNGKKIFASYGCYQCHNYAAHGGGAGPKLAPNPIAYAAFVRQLRTPRSEMPPYTAKVVSDAEIADIYAFLRTVPEPPAAGSIPILKP
jgi:mono/diheme cytochrome c family protein